MKDIRMIFSDIDGTLLNTAHALTERTVEAVRGLADREIPLVLISSRSPEGMAGIHRRLGLRWPMVCFGGALVLESEGALQNRDGVQCGGYATLRSVGIPAGTAAQVYNAVGKACPKVCCTAYSHSRWYVDDVENPWVKLEQAITSAAPTRMALESLEGEVHKLLCMGPEEEIDRLDKLLVRSFPALAVCKSKSTYLEVIDPAATKSSAVRFLCERAGVDPAQVLSLGDHYNDVDMFETTGYSAAMGNAPDEVKARARYLTLDNDHDGAAAILSRLLG